MTSLVIDASVIANVVLEQPLSPQARSVIESGQRLAAPQTCCIETASTLWMAVRHQRLEPSEALERLSSLHRMSIDFVFRSGLQAYALQLALEHNLSLYDAEYIALAIAEDCALVTADRKQLEIARDRCGLGTRAIWLGDL